MTALAADPATEYRPIDADELRDCALELQSRGLKVHDIAVVLGLTVPAAQALLEERHG